MPSANILLLDIPEVIAVALAWPKIYPEIVAAEENKREGLWGAMSLLSRNANVDVDTALRWYPQLRNCGVLLDDGDVDPDVAKFLTSIVERKVAAMMPVDKAKVAGEFLAAMSLDERLEWLTNFSLLEE